MWDISTYKRDIQGKKVEGGNRMSQSSELRAVYQVLVVEPKKGDIILDQKVVASDGNDAILRVNVGHVLSQRGLEYDAVDISATEIARFVRRKKEVQKVQVVQENS